MKYWFLYLVLSLPSLVFADPSDQKVHENALLPVISQSISCGGHASLVLTSGVWSLIPFIGDPRSIYQNLKYGENKNLKEQAAAVGLSRSSLDLHAHAGVVAPLLDIAFIVFGSAWYGYSNLVSYTSGKPISESEREVWLENLEFPITRAAASPAILVGKEAIATCKKLANISNDEKKSVNDDARDPSSEFEAVNENRTSTKLNGSATKK